MKDPVRPMRKNGRTDLFFVEMMIVLLFFGIASAVILRSFAASDRLAEESRLTESISFLSQSAAEFYSVNGDISETAAALVSGGLCTYGISSDTSSVTLDIDNEITACMTEISEDHGGGVLKTLEMTFTDKQGNVVYEFETGAYISEKKVTDGE